MNERDALLKAVCDNPDDDTPRLVFADWLQEHGEEERAEFIRVQCRMRGVGLPEAEFRALGERAAELRKLHGAEWKRELPQVPCHVSDWGFMRRYDPPGLQWGEFRRGFVESVVIDADGVKPLVAEQDRIFATSPIREIEVGYISVTQFTGWRGENFRYCHRIEVIVQHLIRGGNSVHQVEGILNWPIPDRLRVVQLIGPPYYLRRAEAALRPLLRDRLLLVVG